MAKKTALFVLVLIGVWFAGTLAYRMASPEIVVVNRSRHTILETVIQLPSNRVSFGEIAPGSESTIYYSASQADGTNNYLLTLSNGNSISGSCGYVTNSEYGKRLQVVLKLSGEVECRESNKIF
jgi:hypothetical protein